MFDFLESLKYRDTYIMLHEDDGLPIFAVVIGDRGQAQKLYELLETQMYSVIYNRYESEREELVLKFTNYHSDLYFSRILRSRLIHHAEKSGFHICIAYFEERMDKPEQIGKIIPTSPLNHN